MEVVVFAVLFIRIATWLVNAPSFWGRVDFTPWVSEPKEAARFRFTASGHLNPTVAPVKMTAGQVVPTHIPAGSVCSVDWSHHPAFKRSQFSTVVLATSSSKLSPSLVGQGHPDVVVGSLEVIVGHFALIPKRMGSNMISI